MIGWGFGEGGRTTVTLVTVVLRLPQQHLQKHHRMIRVTMRPAPPPPIVVALHPVPQPDEVSADDEGVAVGLAPVSPMVTAARVAVGSALGVSLPSS